MPSPALAYVLAGTALGAALFVWQGDSYWSYSEGVYAETAREFLHGASIYRHVAVAQPPLVIVSGSAILAISDSIWALRAVLGVVDLITGALVAVSVWRVSRNAAASVLAGLLALVTPWMLHEHGHLPQRGGLRRLRSSSSSRSCYRWRRLPRSPLAAGPTPGPRLEPPGITS